MINATSHMTLNDLNAMISFYGISISEVNAWVSNNRCFRMQLQNSLSDAFDIIFRGEVDEWAISKVGSDLVVYFLMNSDCCEIYRICKNNRCYKSDRFLQPYRNLCETVHALCKEGYLK